MSRIRRAVASLVSLAFAAITMAAAGAGVSACGTGENAVPSFDPNDANTPATLCPNDLPKACPSPMPSYATDVAPVLGDLCESCHAEYAQYAQVYKSRSAILDQVFSCRMPLANDEKLTEPQRLALLGWLTCNAPQN